jgi:DNA-binding NarL/FixJ family response regulator
MKPSSKKRIYLVDDHPMVRERLGQVINHEPDLIVCGECGGAPEAMRALQANPPDLVITDLTLKGSHGLELIKNLKAALPQLPILVVSMHDESLYAERVLRAGAKGYITKEQATTKVLVAIRAVLSGQVYVSEEIVARLLNRTAQGSEFGATPVETLADRELQVFQMIGRGLNTREIADELRIGVKTVETYWMRIKEKLNIETGAELIREAIRWENELS